MNNISMIVFLFAVATVIVFIFSGTLIWWPIPTAGGMIFFQWLQKLPKTAEKKKSVRGLWLIFWASSTALSAFLFNCINWGGNFYGEQNQLNSPACSNFETGQGVWMTVGIIALFSSIITGIAFFNGMTMDALDDNFKA